MLTKLKTAALAAVVGFSALAAIPAQADSLHSSDRNTRLGVQIAPTEVQYRHGDGWRDDGRNDRRDDWRDDRRDDRWRHGCTPQRAINKAERMGLHRVRVLDVGRRTIQVSGRKFGDRVRITFARAPNCPIVRR